jgi:hypothetical protein
VDLDDFIVTVYCLVDDLFEEVLERRRLRSRGPNPILDDREVLTIELVGEFLGLDTDKGIFLYFARHYAEWFPKLARLHRTTFARQPTSGRSRGSCGRRWLKRSSTTVGWPSTICWQASGRGLPWWGTPTTGAPSLGGPREVRGVLDRAEEDAQKTLSPSVAQMVDQRQKAHRDGDKPAGGTLRSQAGEGQGPLAPRVSFLQESARPHRMRAPVPASGAAAAALLGASHQIEYLHTGSWILLLGANCSLHTNRIVSWSQGRPQVSVWFGPDIGSVRDPNPRWWLVIIVVYR